MAEGWKQVWEDIRNALRGAQREEAPVATPPETAAGGTAAVPRVVSIAAPVGVTSSPSTSRGYVGQPRMSSTLTALIGGLSMVTVATKPSRAI